ncbi:hypothetical protein ACKVMT_17080 [Halobacteriales archaeon Cl-PHB]
MSVWLTVSRLAVVANLGLLAVLGAVWLGNYRRHGASHTLALLVVAAFLLLENVLWLYFYLGHPGFVGWYEAVEPGLQAGVMALCGLETVALGVLAVITLR